MRLAAQLDLSAQVPHLAEILLALLQPVLWLLLVLGFVLASAHLLTMFGTRWGDRRVSPKAMFFSIIVHASLGLAVIAMIPEYRRHVLGIGQQDPPPVDVKLITSADQPPQASKGAPAWEKIPRPIAQEFDRTIARVTPPAIESLPAREQPLSVPDQRPSETPHLAPAPPVTPELASATASREQRPVDIAPEMPATTGERRVDPAIPEPELARTPTPELQPTEDFVTRPVPPAPLEPAPRPNEEIPLAATTSGARMELPAATPEAALPSARAPAPAPFEIPTEASPGTRESPAISPSEPRPARSRTELARLPDEDLLAPSRSGLLSGTPMPEPTPERQRKARGEDPPLPGAYQAAIAPTELASLDLGSRVPPAFQVRTDQDRKDEAIRKYGGNEKTQQAVERALKWLASVQESSGYWDASAFDAGQGPPERDPEIAQRRYAGRRSDTGITGLVVLAFLGNGNTSREGPYAVHVDAALQWLISQQKSDGSLAGDATVFEAMYCHGIASLALAEAYAMETDATVRSQLRRPLERALAYTRFAQLPDGGWRYFPGQDGGGDMSMFGWQVMALKSAEDGGIPIPEKTRDGMIRFLRDRSLGEFGGKAGYRTLDPPTAPMSAEALACKQFLGLKRDNPMAVEAVSYLLENLPRRSAMNLYYWYYGTLAMFQHGGDAWTRWNDSLSSILVEDQVRTGSLAGSWEPRGPWARYGGRLYSTALSTLCLEVYYRRLPMFQWATPD